MELALFFLSLTLIFKGRSVIWLKINETLKPAKNSFSLKTKI